VAVTAVGLGDDRAAGQVERGEQAGRAVADVVVRHPGRGRREHRQTGGGPVQCLVIRGLEEQPGCFRRCNPCGRVRHRIGDDKAGTIASSITTCTRLNGQVRACRAATAVWLRTSALLQAHPG